jgi:hypothetical protein
VRSYVAIGIGIFGGAISAPPAAADPQWHAGLVLRPELGTHPVRAGGGIQLAHLDTTLVLDPMFWTDGQHDIDLLLHWLPCPRGWGVLGGWRTSAIGLLGGYQLQEKLLVGISAPLPDLGPFRVRWSFELATLVVKHGGDLPTDWISFATGRDFIDLVNFGTFVSIEYASH